MIYKLYRGFGLLRFTFGLWVGCPEDLLGIIMWFKVSWAYRVCILAVTLLVNPQLVSGGGYGRVSGAVSRVGP